MNRGARGRDGAAWTHATLTGIGQVMLQRSAWTGALFLVGIGWHSRVMLVGALLGTVVGMLTARVLRLTSPSEWQQGLYGFNGALVGIVVVLQLPVTAVALALIVAGSVLAAGLMWAGLHWRGPAPYTAPFVIAAWLVLAVIDVTGLPRNGLAVSPDAGVAAAVARGVGQVMFQDDWRSGCLFLVGVALASPRAAVWAVVGSLAGYLLARGLGFPAATALAGGYGFNAVLAAIALGAERGRVIQPLVGIVLAVLLTRALEAAGVPPLTAPFVLATWLVLAARRHRVARRV